MDLAVPVDWVYIHKLSSQAKIREFVVVSLTSNQKQPEASCKYIWLNSPGWIQAFEMVSIWRLYVLKTCQFDALLFP
jgi:hypothetical protein